MLNIMLFIVVFSSTIRHHVKQNGIRKKTYGEVNMGQQEQIKEVTSSMKWVQNNVLSMNDGTAYFNSSFWLKKLEVKWYILVWSWHPCIIQQVYL